MTLGLSQATKDRISLLEEAHMKNVSIQEPGRNTAVELKDKPNRLDPMSQHTPSMYPSVQFVPFASSTQWYLPVPAFEFHV